MFYDQKKDTFAKEPISDLPKKNNGTAISKYGFFHCRVKINVVVESSVTYQNLSAEIYKTNGNPTIQYKCDISKPISRKIQDQWKKN